MRKLVRYLILVFLAFAICGLAGLFLLNSSANAWVRVNETITYSGQPSSASKMYLSTDGNLLIDLRVQGDAIYIINPKAQEIGVPNESNFYTTALYAYSKERTPPTVSMKDKIKIEANPELKIEPYVVEFTSMKKARVRVTWHLNK